MKASGAEFDAYAANYDGGADGPLKRLLGDEKAFLDLKVRWLVNFIEQREKKDTEPLNVLDLGCGTGLMLALRHAKRPQDVLSGADVSRAMLDEAARRWSATRPVDFRLLQSDVLPWEPQSFDLIIISCVLHHIKPENRDSFFRVSFQLMKPGGTVCIFEHNPRNALVRYVVRHTKIDQHAILLAAEETAERARRIGYLQVRTNFILFFPPSIKTLSKLERLFAAIPLGGQYAVTATRPCETGT